MPVLLQFEAVNGIYMYLYKMSIIIPGLVHGFCLQRFSTIFKSTVLTKQSLVNLLFCVYGNQLRS